MPHHSLHTQSRARRRIREYYREEEVASPEPLPQGDGDPRPLEQAEQDQSVDSHEHQPEES